MQYIDYQGGKKLQNSLIGWAFLHIFVAQNLKAMKSKKEQKMNNGEGKEMPAENVKNHDASNEVLEQNSSTDTKSESTDEEREKTITLIEQWAPFLSKFIKVMIAIEDLVEAKKTMESDPHFIYVMRKFMEFKEKFEAEHPEMTEVNDDYECEDDDLFDMVKQLKDNLLAHGISVKVRKVTDPAEVEKFERFMNETPTKNGASKIAEA